MNKELISVEIKIELVEDRVKGKDDKWFRIKGKDIKTNESCFYSWWDSNITPVVGKIYAIRYSFSKPDYKDRKYKNIKDVAEVEIGKEGNIEVNDTIGAITEEPKNVTTTSAPIQKSYSDMKNEDQKESLIKILVDDVKEIKMQIDDISSFIYNTDKKEEK